MRIVVSNKTGVPIYQQIEDQIKAAILAGELQAGTLLPSIRQLAKDLQISVITTTRAYHDLEAAGFVNNVQGKGTYVLGQDSELLRETALRAVEKGLQEALDAAKLAHLSAEELHQMLDALISAGGKTDD
ncbi:GntR family transcriptional regulator [Lentilactobacillus raoultii]|uniref:GntR family transcriptional regulator n=1 Tax=Lentilactobacillus raoultii TaxID=1987503 RepID=A0ABW3PHA6_9LACO|nr:GntR family transcriptional regulator [Lentilactobacillus raoultii]